MMIQQVMSRKPAHRKPKDQEFVHHQTSKEVKHERFVFHGLLKVLPSFKLISSKLPDTFHTAHGAHNVWQAARRIRVSNDDDKHPTTSRR